MPEPQFPAFIPNDPWFNGDGNVSAFRIKDGYIDLKQRYVRTEKFVREAKARRALIGKYRNKYTDAVAFMVRSTANTNVVYWRGKLLALKEDSPPYALDPDTLETLGLYDFNGQLPSLTFTAHPKFDPETREMICFGYEAKGGGTLDVCYYSFNAEEKLTELAWMLAPACGMIHDFGVTKNYVLFPMIPQVCDLERMKAGGEHWEWNSKMPMYIGVLPRRGAKGSDVKWLEAPHGFAGHVANAYEDEAGHIVLEMAYSKDNIFFWWPDKDGKSPQPGQAQCELVRWMIDYGSSEICLSEPKVLAPKDMEFPRIDDRFAFERHRHSFFCYMDSQASTDMAFIGPVLGGGHPLYNGLAHYDAKTKEVIHFFAGPRKLTQEPVFVPRSATAEEGDGYVIGLLNNYDEMCSELVVLDSRNFSEPVALVKLPIRLRQGLHGNWVDAADVDGHPSKSS
ncbi:Lignostilbene-alpha,beta-dioxygenase isozyme I [Fusarium oxysporum f. sp. raphani]|uniref:Lignostilbene-alpha,beta-dioxygenase isozyme I n=1 Tax=Fusarium oxysporum f. sp. raphani TaxID=96318 RepID=A0A8J5P148_FUSOX|nr:Lignostilbene-alpha,beta-dioxygenase isozyme I [Fusarium oxysporum f. sp. raphani]